MEAPSWKPTKFAEAVLEKMDANGDQLIDADELKGAPGLSAGAKFIDKDADGKLSLDELKARFQLYRDVRVGLAPKTLALFYKKKPGRGANVRLVPEFFLTDLLSPATDTTIGDGTFMPQAEGADLSGMQVGYYRVVIDAPGAKLPPEYADETETPLGVEVSPVSDDPTTYGTIPIFID